MSKFRYVAVPFEAVARLHELTPKAALLYVHYCQWRNKETGLAWPSLDLIASTMHIPKTSACELRKQLAERAWVEIVGGDMVRLLVGFPDDTDAEHAENSNSVRESRIAFGKPESDSEKSNGIRESRTEFGKTESDSEKSNSIRKSRTLRSEKSHESFGKVERYIKKNNTKEQHYSLSPSSPSQPDAGEREVELRSRFSLAERQAFVEWQKMQGEPVKSVMAVARLYGDGSADELIEKWQAAQCEKGAIATRAADCPYCRGSLVPRQRRVISTRYPQGAWKACTHDPEIEDKFTAAD